MENNQYARVPLGFARSALFGTSSNKKEQVVFQLEDANLPVQKLRDMKITYSGPALNQHHAILWQSIMSEYREGQPFVEISGGELLRKMGNKSDSGQMHKRLVLMLRELRKGEVNYTSQTHDFFGGMISSVTFSKVIVGEKYKNGPIKIEINSELAKLLGDEVLINDLSRKLTLGNNQLALWLHDFIATHKTLMPIDMGELRKLSRSNYVPKKFKNEAKKALEMLASKDCNLVRSFHFNQRGQLVIEKSETKVVILDNYRPKPKSDKATAAVQKAVQQSRDQRATVAL
jgi:hypothetical protein